MVQTDGYRLLHPLWGDRLGMTHIGRAPDGSPAAVRVLAPELAADPSVRARAVTARARFTAIRHPNLVRVRDVLVGDGVSIVEDAVLGRTLRRGRGRLAPDQLLRIGRGVAAGITELHRHGLWHGTLGPGNVVVDRTGAVVLTDLAVGHLTGVPGSAADDADAMRDVLSAVWRSANGRWSRPPVLPVDVWADTMARARDMG